MTRELTDGHYLDLLWSEPNFTGRGRPPRLSRHEIVQAAVRRADATGLENLTMRSLADDLGAGTMSLYTHVPNRDALIELMIDMAFAEVTDGLTQHTDDVWRTKALSVAQALRGVLTQHPWILAKGSRLPLGPHVLALENASYEAFRGIGLTPAMTVDTANALRSLVTGLVRESTVERHEAQRNGRLSEEHWESLDAVFWDRYYDSARYPALTQLWHDGAFAGRRPGGEDPFNHAVRTYLDGVSFRIDPASI